MVKERPHIGFFGKRNRGKSTLMNALSGQAVSIVSDCPGTTTDPVKKVIEFLDFGPVVLVDTAGYDDTGSLGKQRVNRALSMIDQVDLAVLLIEGNRIELDDLSVIKVFQERKLPYLLVHGKHDLIPLTSAFENVCRKEGYGEVFAYAHHDAKSLQVLEVGLKNKLQTIRQVQLNLFDGLLEPGDVVLLVTPMDSEAPQGRLILPQVQALRHVLDKHCVAIVLQADELASFIENNSLMPRLVVTDSQVFGLVNSLLPPSILLTGFSVLLAHMSAHFDDYLKGTPTIDALKDGDRILLLESCTHQVSCDDIGRVKLPQWISDYTGKHFEYEVLSGLDALTRNIEDYALIIQCGGCMISKRQLSGRLRLALEAGIPISNYGLMIAYVHGIFTRATELFRTSRGL